MKRHVSSPDGCTSILVCAFVIAISFTLAGTPAHAQTTSTWNGGAGPWSNCPPSGTALWDTCGDTPPEYPNGNFNAVINGGPVTATSASIVNLTLSSGTSLNFPAGTTDLLQITGTSIVNNGTINIDSLSGLYLLGPTTVTLSGSGTVNIAGSNFIGSNSTPTFIVQQPIQGYGSFSLGMNLTNQSTINATGGTLEMQPSSVVNTGTLEASSGATLSFSTGGSVPYNNTGGTIKALSGGTVQMNNSVYTGGTLTTVGTGVIQANGDAILNNLTSSGTVQAIAASLEGTITNTGTIQVSSGTLSMDGSVTLSGSGSIIMSGTSNLNQFDGAGSLTNQQLIHGSGTIYELPLTNQKTLSADSKGNTLYLEGGTTTNTATLEATGGGTLELDTVVNNTGGTIEALNGSTVIFTSNFNGSINGGILKTTGTGIIESQNGLLDGTVNIPTNAGQLSANGENLYIQGTINNTGTIALSGNTCMVLEQPSTLTGTGKLTMTSTTCIYGSGNTLTNQSTIQGAGSIGDSNPMPITNSGTIIANQSTPLVINPNASGFTNTGKLTANAGSTLTLNGLFTNLSTTGTLTGGTYNVTGTLGLPESVVTNSANITLTGAAAEILYTGGSTNGLKTLASNTTAGTLSLQSGQVLTTAASLSNAGKITVGASSGLTLGGSYTQTAGTTTVDGTLTAPTGLTLQKGSLVGKGTLAAAVTSDASVTTGDSTTKPGKLTVTGSYMQKATGTLTVPVGGSSTGSFGELAVSNGVSLSGTLTIKLINGFVPTVGESFTILTGSAVSGQFTKVNGTTINSSEKFEVNYTSTEVTLTVVSG